MGEFLLLDHTADVGILASGESLAEALSWVAKGMFSLIAEMDDVVPRESLNISVTSSDPSALIVDWLNELIYRYEAEGFLPKEFDVTVDNKGTSLLARCMGESLDHQRHRILSSVKAATYHDLVASHNGEWRIQVILDI